MAKAGKQAAQTTPGRRSKKASNNQYFDVGKVGRKTGITLRDTGLRDEHGLEPTNGIFSSPVVGELDHDRTLQSGQMDVDEGSMPDVDETLASRRTPRFPPARTSTPRHTNIGSPKRMSSTRAARQSNGSAVDASPVQSRTQPPPNRVLDFNKEKNNRNRRVTNVYDTRSPFKPRKVLRRSTVLVHADPLPPNRTPLPQTNVHASIASIERTQQSVEEEQEDVEQSIEVVEPDDDGPLTLDDDGTSEAALAEQLGVSLAGAQAINGHYTPSRHTLRISQSPTELAQMDQTQHTPGVAVMLPPSSKKRNRSSLHETQIDGDTTAPFTQDNGEGPSTSRKRGRLSGADSALVTDRYGSQDAIDPSLLAHGDEYMVEEPNEPTDTQDTQDTQAEMLPDTETTEPRTRGRPKGKQKANGVPKERDPNRAMQKSPVAARERSTAAGKRKEGSISNVNLRATTPFEDAAHRTSRSGRNLIKPLKFWENESVIWKHGDIEGIIRADPVVKLESKSSRQKKRGRKRASRLDDIEEESETESLAPDEWETTHGVISGNVAKWNPALNSGDPDDPVREDIAFAGSAIITRDVVGGDCKYAKIMTIPFFGAGIVEIPPEGFKRAKNSRKNQMLFFVHEGKVMVEVGAIGMEVNQFALTKGGVWSVPRGNNYAIVNESRTKTAKIFFAQGSMVYENSER